MQTKFLMNVSMLAERSPFIWAVSYIALPKGIPWSFDDRKWQIPILDDTHPSLVIRKPTQIGMTTISTIKALWFVSYIKSRAMITLPRRDDVTDYVPSILDPMIEGSEFLSARVGKTDTVRLKRIGESFIHIMEASVRPRMLPIDILTNDEVDLSDPDNIEEFKARLDASKYQYHYRFSTPTVAGFGIDAEYDRSDMREWTIRCSRCNKDFVMDWEINVARPSGEESPYYICDFCKRPIRTDDIINGRWIPGRESDTHGYHVSHMMIPITRPLSVLINDEATMKTKTFYNLRLGKPWRPVGGSMSPELFRDNAFKSMHGQKHYRESGYRYFMGADQGNEIHVTVGRVPNDGDPEYVEVIYAKNINPRRGENPFDRLGAIIRMFDIDFGLCDANPNRILAYDLAAEFHGKLGAVDIGEFNYPYKWSGFKGESPYKLTCSRTDMLDGLRDWISSGRLSLWGTWGNRDDTIRDIISHCGRLKRDTDIRRTKGGAEKVVGVWRSTGDDDYAFALGMLRLAVIIGKGKSDFRFAVIDDSQNEDHEDMELRESSVWEGLSYYVERKKKGERAYIE